MIKNLQFDFERQTRTAVPEAVFCEGKTPETVLRMLENFSLPDSVPVLFTRLDSRLFAEAPDSVRSKYLYDPIARVAYAKKNQNRVSGSVALISAGTSDARVIWEAARTLEFMNTDFEVFEDAGVAGLWRLQRALPNLNRHKIIIAAAGMEAALTSVLAGLTPRPIIGVPVSNGYGVCEKGKTALKSMLAACSPGIGVVNIDNGFGAACLAYKILYSFTSLSE